MSPQAASFARPASDVLPPEAPLAMPVQDLARAPPLAVNGASDTALRWRRAVLLGGSGAIGLLASCGVALPLAVDGFDWFDQAFVLLSLALFAWLALGFLNALAGWLVLVSRRPSLVAPSPLPRERIAILVPVYNEEVAPLHARLARMRADLAHRGAMDRFDLFVLSDSGPLAEPAEQTMLHALRAAPGPAIYYRRRSTNSGRKPGNIADWVRRFGAAYPFMLVLDADSVMTADAMLRLAAALEADPALGLVQTNPLVNGARTLFARWQQFAAAFAGPASAAGLAWWSGEEATFWGHNAMLRTRAFAQSCGLPMLPGSEPMGGAILSHDMVEAALLRRRGWRTRLLVLEEGSYEESPPTLVDHGIRDRRWCQGNLQHLRLLDTAGLHWISRLQLLMGASAYLASPLWLLVLAGGLVEAIRSGVTVAGLGTPAWLIALTLTLLFGPRLLSLAWCARNGKLLRRLGGWRAVLPSAVADLLLSIAVAPAIMASQCQAIGEIVAGGRSGWSPQRRSSRGITLEEALDRYRWHLPLGLAFWIVSLSELGGGIWSLPVALGLLAAPLLAAITSSERLGSRLARWGIFSAEPDRRPEEPCTFAAIDQEAGRAASPITLMPLAEFA